MATTQSTRTVEQRFWAKVDRRETHQCWPWRGAYNNRSKHGQFAWRNSEPRRRGVLVGAHRAAWLLTHGPIPDGLHVCHRCDYPPCCNPAHLFLGTHQDNMRDSVQKGRAKFPKPRRGEANNKAKLTWPLVREVRRAYLAGETLSSLSRRLDVARSTLREVVDAKTWAEGATPIPRQKWTFRFLSDAEVVAIRAMYAQGVTQVALAREYNSNQGYISNLIRGKTRKDLPLYYTPIRYVPRTEPQQQTIPSLAEVRG